MDLVIFSMWNTAPARKSVQYVVFLLLHGCQKMEFQMNGQQFLA